MLLLLLFANLCKMVGHPVFANPKAAQFPAIWDGILIRSRNVINMWNGQSRHQRYCYSIIEIECRLAVSLYSDLFVEYPVLTSNTTMCSPELTRIYVRDQSSQGLCLEITFSSFQAFHSPINHSLFTIHPWYFWNQRDLPKNSSASSNHAPGQITVGKWPPRA